MSSKRFAAALLLTICMRPAPTAAQPSEEPDLSKARVRIGPLALGPTIELTNFGIDTNVFNEPVGQAKRDLTFTLTPKSDLWLKMGPTWVTGTIREDVVWYQTYSSERSGNRSYSAGWLVPLNHVRLDASGTYLNTRDRPGFEIDTRARRRELLFKGSAEVRALVNTYFGVKGTRQTVDYDPTAAFLTSNLRVELNRVVTSGALTVRHQLTPLTAIIFDVGRQQDRFDLSPLRDSNSTTAGVQVKFDPFALIKGSARVGYRDFRPLGAGVPGYQGPTAAADLTYSFLGTTRFGVQVTRDVQYSYDVNQPYYVQTGINGSIGQQIYGPLDVVARAGVHTLRYRDRAGAPVQVTGQNDTVHSYGGGVGYHVGAELRIGVNIDRQQRLSDIAQRRYEGLRVGTSVTYGF